MNLRCMVVSAAALVLAGCGCCPNKPLAKAVAPEPFPPATPQAVVAISKTVFPAVVRIDVAQEIYSQGKRTLQRGIGSGVIIDSQGHILTNYHVAGRAAELYVTLASKERLPAKLIGDDHWTDLAVIQLDMAQVHQKHIQLKYAELGDSNHVVTGQDVMAIGTPFGLNRTATLGIISNNERTFYPEQMHIDDYETGEFANWIQMDTPINPGNSGGPLVDMDGKVIGINTRGGGQNLNFAIPIDTAKPVIAAILKSAGPGKLGHVDRSELGIDFKPMQDLEQFYKVNINKGVLINSVENFSTAKKARLQSQDILISINGTPTNVRFPEELAGLRDRIASLPIGATCQLKVLRNKKPMLFTLKTQKLQGFVGDEKALKIWGMSVREVTREYANQEQLDSAKGVVITTLTPDLPASKADLGSGDVILSIDQKPANDLAEFMRLYNKSVKQKESRVLLQIERGHGELSSVLKVTYDGNDSASSQPSD